LPDHAERMGWEIVDHYEEPGVSGDGLVTRPAMMRLLADAQKGMFDVILAIADDRFRRGPLADAEYVKPGCDENGISLATPSGIFYRPGNADDDFTTDMRFAVTKREKKNIKRRLATGKVEAAHQRCLPHSTAALPYGFQFERRARRPDEKKDMPSQK